MTDDTETEEKIRKRKARGSRMAARRKQLGLSQADIGRDLDMSSAGYGMYERGLNGIDIDHLPAIARHLQVPLGWFFEEHGPIAYGLDDLNRIAVNMPALRDRAWLADVAEALSALPEEARRRAEDRLRAYLEGLLETMRADDLPVGRK